MSNRGSKICLCDLWINHRGERRGRWYQMRTVREGMKIQVSGCFVWLLLLLVLLGVAAVPISLGYIILKLSGAL